MNNVRKLQWGVLSTSSTAIGKAIPALFRCENATVAAIASRDAEKASACARRFGIPRSYETYHALLADPAVEAVYVPLPNSLHGEWTVKAARAGKHVLCEKPASVHPNVVEEMLAACVDSGVTFQEGFMYRCHPQFATARDWLASGKIGRLRLVRVTFSFPLEDRHSRIRLQAALDGGALADVGSYGIDLAGWLTGLEPHRVFAVGSQGFDADVETGFTAVLEMPNGIQVTLDGGFDRPRHSRCEIVGQKGNIAIDSPFLSGVESQIVAAGSEGEERHRFPPQDLFHTQFERFSSSVLTGSPVGISPSETLRTSRVQAALRKSLQTGRAVNLDPKR